MIKIQLTYHLYHSWKTENATSVIGTAFKNDELLKETALLHNFQTITNEESFKEKLQQLDGHFSIVTETETSVFIAVDTIRTFPLFIYSTAADILITDTIEPIYFTNETIDVKEVENFCKVYCTLENKTLLKGWLQLQAGEYAVIDKQTAEVNY
jgi:asparagine synthetase B (glutamine-hydrolysing)